MSKCRIMLIDINRISLDTSRDMLEYPIGLLYLASSLEKAFGNEVETRIVSYDHRRHGDSDVENWIREFRPDILGLRSLTMGKGILHQIAHVAKERLKVPLVIAGGPHATDSPFDVMENKSFDLASLGEGEKTVVEIVRAYMNNETFETIEGLAVRSDKGIRLTPPRPLITDLDTLPPPDHSATDFEAINKGHVDFSFRYNVPHANLFTSRGCPYKCIYCHHVFGKKFRFHSAERVFEEVKSLYENHGIRSFQIVDDIFNLHRKRALDFFDRIVKSNMKVTFSFPNGVRGDIIDKEVVEAMWEGGVRYMAYAVESGSPRIQTLIRKNLKLDRIKEAITMSTAKGIVTRGFFMFGFPTETEEEVRMTIDFATSSDLVTGMFFTVLYFPGTPLYELAHELTDMFSLDLRLEDDYVSVREGPYDFSRERLEELKREAIRKFFFSEKRLDFFFRLMPNFYSQRDSDAAMLVNIISGEIKATDVEDPVYGDRLHRYFIMAERFSEKSGFFV
ncbi:MAG: B12-binding domain-containing radical SAM protein [Candidatus Zixiibacteriota bacterium]|nr:MAG: B12-binding domain-containing radical SAM protein [candidate division Zixibacteria bacterium]